MTNGLFGPTTRGHTTTVVTPWGRETYQVWLNEVENEWVARIVTLPNKMWAMPGGREAVKFAGRTMIEAEAAAVRFIEEECVRTRRRAAPHQEGVRPLDLLRRGELESATLDPTPRPAPRYPHRLLVKFGVENPERPGVTANISETGMFIITDRPEPVGARLLIDLRIPDGPVFLGGEVVWTRERREPGRSLGFGVRLIDRPVEYVQHLKQHE